MFDKPFDKLNIKDIENLVLIRKEQENNYLEYKERIEPNDKFKKKFLKIRGKIGTDTYFLAVSF